MRDGWNKIVPGGDTMCSRGSEFAFAVRKGASSNIVIDFVGFLEGFKMFAQKHHKVVFKNIFTVSFLPS